jgi:hypothetical protein
MKNVKYLLPALFTGALALAQISALADSAYDIENGYPGNNNTAVTYDDNGSGNYPIITAILSAPVGSLDGYTYSTWAYFAADTTGSMDIFYKSSANVGSYTAPTVGDTILASGIYTAYDGIPEMETTTASPTITVNGPGSQGNAPYATVPALSTIPTINVGTNTGGSTLGLNTSGLAGQLIQLNNVTIGTNGAPVTAGTLFPTHGNGTYSITDQHGNSMTLYFWASTYSTDGALGGTAIPTGTVDITGFVDDYANSAEFVPMSFTVVPEPSTLSLGGLSSLLAFAGYRLRKKA